MQKWSGFLLKRILKISCVGYFQEASPFACLFLSLLLLDCNGHCFVLIHFNIISDEFWFQLLMATVTQLSLIAWGDQDGNSSSNTFKSYLTDLISVCCSVLQNTFLKIIFHMLLTLKSLLVNPSELADHGDLVRERIASHEIIMVLMIEQRNSCLQPFLLL